MPTPFGTLYSPNITPDLQDGIGQWSADDFYATMHAGRMPDGALIYPAMPFGSYTKVTREDSDAIFAYLRSVPPVARPSRPQDLRFPFDNRILILGWRTLFFHEGTFQPDTTKPAEWNRGAYLVEGLAHCGMCHTPIDKLGGNSESKAFQGGLIPMQGWYAPSLTSNKETGLGDWSLQDIEQYLQKGVSARGAVYGPMSEVVYNSLQYMTDEDIRAIAVYVQSLAQRNNPAPEVARGIGGREQSADAARGKGVLGAVRDLSWRQGPWRADALSGARRQSIHRDGIRRQSDPHGLNGGFPPGTPGNPMPYGMPPFAQSLSNDEVAAVVSLYPLLLGQSWHGHLATPSR